MNKNNRKDSELRSIGVQRLLNQYPHQIILKGNFFIIVTLLISLSIVSYYVKYPEFIPSKVIIEHVENPGYNQLLTGQITLLQKDLNKVKKGQKVIVKLHDFPYQEFGVINAQIQTISDSNDHPEIYISFPNGLHTSYNKKIIYNQKLKGNAEVIVQDTRFIQRMISYLKEIF